jgi:peroxiredoxin
MPDYSHMTYDEVQQAVESLAPQARIFALLGLAKRTDIDPQQRLSAYGQALHAVPAVHQGSPDDSGQITLVPYNTMGSIFEQIAAAKTDDAGIDELLPVAARQYMEILEATAQLHGRFSTAPAESGELSRDYSHLAEVLSQRQIHLDDPSPSLRARDVLGSIDSLAEQQVDFSLPDAHGKSYTLAGLRGKIVLLDFWATWCGPCIKDMPLIRKLQTDLAAKGVVVLGIGEESAAAIRGFEQKNPPAYPTLIDAGRKLHDQFGVDGIPVYIVINRNGVVVDRVSSPRNEPAFLTVLQQAGLDRSENR